LREEQKLEWNRKDERVEAVSTLLFDRLTIEETRGGAPDAEGGSRSSGEKVLEMDSNGSCLRKRWKQCWLALELRVFTAGLRAVGNTDIKARTRGALLWAQTLRDAQAACEACGFSDASCGSLVQAFGAAGAVAPFAY